MNSIFIILNLFLLSCQASPMDRESRWWTIVNDILRSENPELFHDLKSNLFYWGGNKPNDISSPKFNESNFAGKNTIAKFVTTLSNVIVNEISNTPTDLSINIATTTEEDTDLMERIGPAALASLAG